MKKLLLVMGMIGALVLTGCGGPVSEDEVAAAQALKSSTGEVVSISRKGNTLMTSATYDSAFKFVGRAVDVYGYRTVASSKSKGYVKAVPGKTKPLGVKDQPTLEIMVANLGNRGVRAEVIAAVNGVFDKKLSERAAAALVKRYLQILDEIAAQNRK